MYIHIREFEERNETMFPTLRKIVMSLGTRKDFSSKILDLDEKFPFSGALCNNSVIVNNDQGVCLLKNIFKNKNNNFCLKKESLKMHFDMLINLKCEVHNFTDYILNYVLTQYLPMRILERKQNVVGEEMTPSEGICY